jgi:CRP/FNR family cyclic AMP-dependent transcriptional regulator
MEAKSKREVLSESPLFDNLLPTELSMLADLFTERAFEAGQIVFEEGDVGEALYVIADGKVEVLRDSASQKRQVFATLEARNFFGEMSLLDKESRSATVRAAVPTRVLMLTHANLHIFAKNYRNGFTWIVVNIARELSRRLRDANKLLAQRL